MKIGYLLLRITREDKSPDEVKVKILCQKLDGGFWNPKFNTFFLSALAMEKVAETLCICYRPQDNKHRLYYFGRLN